MKTTIIIVHFLHLVKHHNVPLLSGLQLSPSRDFQNSIPITLPQILKKLDSDIEFDPLLSDHNCDVSDYVRISPDTKKSSFCKNYIKKNIASSTFLQRFIA